MSEDASRLVGLLADDARLRVLAAIVLGAATADEVADVTGLGARSVAAALGRLVADKLMYLDDRR